MKVLLVEDEPKVLSFIKKGFKEHGACVDTAPDGREGYLMAVSENYDCIVLDIMMPNLNGYEFIQLLRKEGNLTPVIFLTAKGAVEDRVKGLELGADDYIVKPFAFSELLARVRAITRRGAHGKPENFAAGNIKIDIKKHIALCAGKEITLTPKEFVLLQYMIEHKGEVVTRTMLSENVWGYHFDSMTNVIDVHVTNLRKKIEIKKSGVAIRTIRGVGYVLEEK